MAIEILLGVIFLALLIPFIVIYSSRILYASRFKISIAIAKTFGFLLSINGVIRVGKTSFMSGIKHIFEILMMQELQKVIELTKLIFRKVNFNFVNGVIDGEIILSLNNNQKINFDSILFKIKQEYDLDNNSINNSNIFNFIGNKKFDKYFTDYIEAYYVLNYRNNLVHSKTPIYSHITGNVAYDYNLSHHKIHIAYERNDYGIENYMVELIDEATDEIGAGKRFEDIKDEHGDKDYRRKYGHIHEEKNRLITTKQNVKDEIKGFRQLTQSNLYIPEKLSQRGTFRKTLKFVKFVVSPILSIFKLFRLYIPFFFYWLKNRNSEDYICLQSFIDLYMNAPNFINKVKEFIQYLDWFLFSLGYNAYTILNYLDEDDVKKRDPLLFDHYTFYIPIIYCFGTYDTHYYRNIQEELMASSQSVSHEQNFFKVPKYFGTNAKGGDEIDDTDITI